MASILSAASCGMFRQLLGMSQIYEYVTRSELLQVPLQYIQVNYVVRKAWTALRPSVGTMRQLRKDGVGRHHDH